MDVLGHSSSEETERTSYLIKVAQTTNEQAIASPLARITTCGTLTIDVLQKIRCNADGQYEAMYGSPEQKYLARKGTSTAFTLLSLLASQPDYFASKDWLSEKLGHFHTMEDEVELDDEGEGLKRVDNVVSRLRFLLYPARAHESQEEQSLRRRLVAYRRASGESGPGYQLAGSSLLWLDVVHIEAHVKQARKLEQFGVNGSSEWQSAYTLAMRGRFLPTETYSDWVEWRRQEVERYLWECVQQLWKYWTRQGEYGETKALHILRDYWHNHVTNEDALRLLIDLLKKKHCFGEAISSYELLCRALAAEGKHPDRRTSALVEFQQAEQYQQETDTTTKEKSSLDIVSPPVVLSRQQYDRFSPFAYTVSQDIMKSAGELEKENQSMDPLRRATVVGLLSLIGGITASSDVSDTSASNLATITQQFRAMQRRGDAFITNGVKSHIQTIQEALEQTVNDPVRRELWRVLAQTQTIAGFNPTKKKKRGQAKTFLEAAVASAQNSGDALLIGASIGHLAHFALREEQNLMKATQLLHQAQKHVPATHPLSGWFALVMASIAAKEGHKQQCEGYLTNAMTNAHHLSQTPDTTDLYFTDFSLTSAHIFTVNCWLVIGEAAKAYGHLTQMNLEDLADNRRASAYCDASKACAQMGEFELAQQLAFRAIDKASSTQQHYVIPRCLAVAQTIKQKAPDKSYATAITDYAHVILQQN